MLLQTIVTYSSEKIYLILLCQWGLAYQPVAASSDPLEPAGFPARAAELRVPLVAEPGLRWAERFPPVGPGSPLVALPGVPQVEMAQER